MKTDLTSERYIGDFKRGDVYHHGAVMITPVRNRQYVKKFGEGAVASNAGFCRLLGYADPEAAEKKNSLGIENPALASRGFLFNAGFGLSVHDVSFNAIANLSYSNLVFGVPVFEGDIIAAKSTVLGTEFRKDGAKNGSVQVSTVITNQRGEQALRYTRQVLVRAAKGCEYAKSSAIAPQPEKIDISEAVLPLRVPEGLLPDGGETFESLAEGQTLPGSFERGLTLADFSWLQIATLNDAAVHHTPSSVFIGYGGAVKALCEGAVAAHFPFAFHLGMNSGAHNAPTYPADIVRDLYADGKEDGHEKIRAKALIAGKRPLKGRDDFGIVTVRLTGEKRVTDGGMKALNAAGFSGVDAIFEEEGKKFLKVLTLEQEIAVPTEKSFKRRA